MKRSRFSPDVTKRRVALARELVRVRKKLRKQGYRVKGFSAPGLGFSRVGGRGFGRATTWSRWIAKITGTSYAKTNRRR